MATDKMATNWDKVIQQHERGTELLREMRDLYLEYMENQKTVSETALGAMGGTPDLATPTRAVSKVKTPRSTVRKASTSERGSKKQFVEQYFRNNPEIRPKEIQEAWVNAGNKDTISGSLIYKIKYDLQKELGQTNGRKRAASARKVTNKRTPKTDNSVVGESDPQLRQVIVQVLEKDAHSVAELTEAIETDSLMSDLPDADSIMQELQMMRDAGLVERGEGRKYMLTTVAAV